MNEHLIYHDTQEEAEKAAIILCNSMSGCWTIGEVVRAGRIMWRVYDLEDEDDCEALRLADMWERFIDLDRRVKQLEDKLYDDKTS